jgi:general stress protein 13
MKKGDIVKGRITSIKPYGAFVKVNDTVDGLIHVSEISYRFVRSIEDYLSVGDVVDLEVIGISEDKKISFSYRTQNKTGRKKREIIELTRGFKPLGEKLDEWIEEYNKKR